MWPLGVTVVISLCAVLTQAQKTPVCAFEKSVIVHFHGWTYNDIRNECNAADTRFFCAFQISPPIEHQQINMTFPPNARNPWWQRYNPVSYVLTQTDSGSEAELEAMIAACNANNIRIYVDFEINNMGDRTFGYGSAGNYYQGDPASLSYPAVPFGPSDFHVADTTGSCPTSTGNIEDINNITQLRFCARRSTPRRSDTGFLNDLKTGSTDVLDEMIEAMNTLVDMGVAGFRFAHARFVQPAEASYIVSGVRDLAYPGSPLNTRPFFYQDVFPDSIIPASDYSTWGRVEEVNAAFRLSNIIRKRSSEYVLANLTNWGPAMGLIDSEDAVVFLDDPALQRGWVANWDDDVDLDLEQVLSYRDPKLYEMGSAFMMAHPYGYFRIHSSFDWNRAVVDGQDLNEYQGPPRYANDTVVEVEISEDGHACSSTWNCEHRNKAILGMVRFSNLAQGQDAFTTRNFWSNGRDQLAFSRATAGGTDRGFIVINNENTDLDAFIYTGLPAGSYCDLITSDQITDPCTSGKTITVDISGRANIFLPADDPIGVIAIYNTA